jgi:nucleoside-triphosphatase THEP1
MSQVYNPEAEVIAEIEKLELEAREFRRKIEHVRNNEDRRVINRLIGELRDKIHFLRRRIP